MRGEGVHQGEAHRGQVPRPEGLSLVGVEVERISGMIEDSDPAWSAKDLGTLSEMKDAIWKNPGGKSLADALMLQVEHHHLLLSSREDDLTASRRHAHPRDFGSPPDLERRFTRQRPEELAEFRLHHPPFAVSPERCTVETYRPQSGVVPC